MYFPDQLLGAAFRVLEKGGNSIFKSHPHYAENQKELDEAYGAVKSKLTFEEMDAIESAHGSELCINFETGYILGLLDGIKAEGASPVK